MKMARDPGSNAHAFDNAFRHQVRTYDAQLLQLLNPSSMAVGARCARTAVYDLRESGDPVMRS